MPLPKNLPTRADGVDGLLRLADALGDERVFSLIRRCRTSQGLGKDPAGETLTILAHRMVLAEMKEARVDRTRARNTVAERLGYDTLNIPNFNRVMNGEGGPGDDELLDFAEHYGDAAVYELVLLCRTARDAEKDAGRAALTDIGVRLVQAEGGDFDSARAVVADRLGYHDAGTRSNFYKILRGGRPPETRPHSSARGRR
jgi:hypothetical protein